MTCDMRSKKIVTFLLNVFLFRNFRHAYSQGVQCSWKLKDRQQERTAVLSRSYLNALCACAPYTLYVNYIYLESQLINLSTDINIT